MSISPLLAGMIGGLGGVADPVKQVAGAAGSFAAYLGAAVENTVEEVAAVAESDERVKDQQDLAQRFASTQNELSWRESMFRDLTGRDPAYPGEPVRFEEVARYAEERLVTIGQEVSQRLREAGIDPGLGIRVSVGHDGRLIVPNHPEREKIEQLLNEDPELAGELRRLTATFEMVRAAKEHLEFAAAYRQDPIAAVAQHAHLFNGSNGSGTELLLDEFSSMPVTKKSTVD